MLIETVEVRQTHIDKGRQRDGSSCPIAKACDDAGIKDVHVNHGSIYMRSDDKLGSKKPFLNDTFVSNWIDTFDNNGEVVPFKFRIDYKESRVNSIA